MSCVLVIAGCGGDGRIDVVPVSGKVTCEGQPVTSGALSFVPIVAEGETGKSAVASIGADGTFTVTTYDAGDGAAIGKYDVTYSPPIAGEGEESDDEEGASATPVVPLSTDHPCRFGGAVSTPVEIVDGENNLTIELSGQRPGRARDDDSGAD